jgi:inositol transporter-like SP family MFS transporter
LTVTPRILLGAGVALPLLTTGLFLLFWNIASSTLGSYGTYLLVTVTGLTQSQATGLVLVTFPPALVMSVIFVRLADTVWRDRLFVVAMVLQIAAFATGALTGGTLVVGMVAVTVLYSLSNVFAGEAAYKVWSQLLFPADVRATALGVTYGVARGAAAAFTFLVPALMARDAGGVMWILTCCVTVSGLLGLVITRHSRLRPQLQPSTAAQS